MPFVYWKELWIGVPFYVFVVLGHKGLVSSQLQFVSSLNCIFEMSCLTTNKFQRAWDVFFMTHPFSFIWLANFYKGPGPCHSCKDFSHTTQIAFANIPWQKLVFMSTENIVQKYSLDLKTYVRKVDTRIPGEP